MLTFPQMEKAIQNLIERMNRTEALAMDTRIARSGLKQPVEDAIAILEQAISQLKATARHGQ